jgi:hypothetical protein
VEQDKIELVVKKPLAIFHACGRSRMLSLCSRLETREIFRINAEYLFYRRFLKHFEKLVYDVIIPIIIRPLISDEHGSVGGRSCGVFSYFVLSEMEDGLQVNAVYTDFSKAFDRMNHVLLLGTLTRKFRRPMIFWMGSYLTGRTQRVRVGDNLSETIYCHSGVPQGSHLGPVFFIANINDVLDIFENVRVLAYAN